MYRYIHRGLLLLFSLHKIIHQPCSLRHTAHDLNLPCPDLASNPAALAHRASEVHAPPTKWEYSSSVLYLPIPKKIEGRTVVRPLRHMRHFATILQQASSYGHVFVVKRDVQRRHVELVQRGDVGRD